MNLRAAVLIGCISCLIESAAYPGDVIRGWGEWINPDGDCEYQQDGKSLTIKVIGEPPHDYAKDQDMMNAPRVLRPGKDLSTGFIAEVTIAGGFAPGPSGYHGAGLVYAVDESDCVRLERANFRGRQYINFEQRRGGGRPRSLSGDWRIQFDPSKPIQFRLIANDSHIVAGAKQDGGDWQYWSVRNSLFGPQSRVGILGVNTSNRSFQPTYSDFKFSSDPALISRLPARVFANDDR